jgi:hypothetical protein
MAKAKAGDSEGAIADYSSAIEAPDSPDDVKAMALYNRALAYSVIRDDAKAVEDLTLVLKMPGAPADIKAHAQERRDRIKRRAERRPTPF